MNIQVDPTSSNRASAMLNSKIRPRAVVGYGVKIFYPSPPNDVTRSPGIESSSSDRTVTTTLQIKDLISGMKVVHVQHSGMKVVHVQHILRCISLT